MKKINPYKMFVGSFIPNFVLRRPELSDGAKLCYGRLSQYAGANGTAFPKIKTLAKELGVADRTAFRYIKELKNQGLITTINRSSASMPSLYFFLEHEWMTSTELPTAKEKKLPTSIKELAEMDDESLKEIMKNGDLVALVNTFSCAEPPDILAHTPVPLDHPPDDVRSEEEVIKVATQKILREKNYGRDSKEDDAPSELPEPLRDSSSYSDFFPNSKDEERSGEKKRKIPLKEKKRILDVEPEASSAIRPKRQLLPTLRTDVMPTPKKPIVPEADAPETTVTLSNSLSARREAVKASLAQASVRAAEVRTVKQDRLNDKRTDLLMKDGKLTEDELKTAYKLLEETWAKLLVNKYPDSAFVPKFGPKEKNICKQLVSTGYKVDLIQRTMKYVVENWENVRARFFKNNPAGAVTIQALYGLHEALFREADLFRSHMAIREEHKNWVKSNPGNFSIPKSLQDRNKEAKTFLESLGHKV